MPDTAAAAPDSYCAECDFTYADHTPATLPDEIVALAARYPEQLLGDDQFAASLRVRPAPEVWSRLEYACHVRDVLQIQGERIPQAVIAHNPSFPPMRRDERVIELSYNEQDPGLTAELILTGSSFLVLVLESLMPDDWNRPALYNFPEPRQVTVTWIAQRTLHELRHHLLDITLQS